MDEPCAFSHLEWDTELDFINYSDHCLTLIEIIRWNDNIHYEDDTSLEWAMDLCLFNGQDGGRQGAYGFMPTDKSLKAWEDFYRYLNWCYSILN